MKIVHKVHKDGRSQIKIHTDERTQRTVFPGGHPSRYYRGRRALTSVSFGRHCSLNTDKLNTYASHLTRHKLLHYEIVLYIKYTLYTVLHTETYCKLMAIFLALIGLGRP